MVTADVSHVWRDSAHAADDALEAILRSYNKCSPAKIPVEPNVNMFTELLDTSMPTQDAPDKEMIMCLVSYIHSSSDSLVRLSQTIKNNTREYRENSISPSVIERGFSQQVIADQEDEILRLEREVAALQNEVDKCKQLLSEQVDPVPEQQIRSELSERYQRELMVAANDFQNELREEYKGEIAALKYDLATCREQLKNAEEACIKLKEYNFKIADGAEDQTEPVPLRSSSSKCVLNAPSVSESSTRKNKQNIVAKFTKTVGKLFAGFSRIKEDVLEEKDNRLTPKISTNRSFGDEAHFTQLPELVESSDNELMSPSAVSGSEKRVTENNDLST